MKKKQHPLTKAELQSEFKKLVHRISKIFFNELHSLKLDKRLDKIDTKIELTFEEFRDLMFLVKHHHDKIKELEKKVNDLGKFHRS